MTATQRNIATSTLYILTAAACSIFSLSRNLEAGGRWFVLLLIWLLVTAIPLLFVFAYARFLFSEITTQKQRKFAAIVNSVPAVATTILFSVLATPFWKNPVRDLDDSITYLLAVIAVLAIFLVAAIFLLLKNKSSLAIVASILLWPYCLYQRG